MLPTFRTGCLHLSWGRRPYERWHEKTPDVSHMWVFGFIAYAHIPDEERRKMDKKAMWDMQTVLRAIACMLKRKRGFWFIVMSNSINQTRLETGSRNILFRDWGNHGNRWTKESEVTVNSTVRTRCRIRKTPRRYEYDAFVGMLTVDHHANIQYHVTEPNALREAMMSPKAKE